MPLLLQECPGIFINVWFSLKKHVRAALAPGAMAIKEMQFSQCVTAGFSSTFPSVLVFSAPHPPRKRVKFPVHCINYMGNEPLCPIQVAFWMYSPSSHSCMLIEACTVESTEWISERNLVWEGLILAVRLTCLLPVHKGPMDALDWSCCAFSRNTVFWCLGLKQEKWKRLCSVEL